MARTQQKYRKLTVVLPDVLWEALEREAGSEDRTISYVARRILGEHYGKQPFRDAK